MQTKNGDIIQDEFGNDIYVVLPDNKNKPIVYELHEVSVGEYKKFLEAVKEEKI